MKKSYVYVVGAAEMFDVVKIGISCMPVATGRLQSLQTGNPLRLVVWHEEKVLRRFAENVERKAHSILAEKRLIGEWFKVMPRDAIEIVRASAEPYVELRQSGTAVSPYDHADVIAQAIESGDQRVISRIAGF
jgi:hypothetical protein